MKSIPIPPEVASRFTPQELGVMAARFIFRLRVIAAMGNGPHVEPAEKWINPDVRQQKSAAETALKLTNDTTTFTPAVKLCQ